jgi:filamentous hemagglutinin family protein
VIGFDYRIYRRDGSIIWVRENSRAVVDDNGVLLYYEGILQDITERKRIENDLRRQLEELRIEIDHQKLEQDVASITQSGPTTTITQTSDRAVLDWQSFDIGTHEAVRFHQPSSQAVALNRVTGSQSPTQILGKLSATGQVVLVNPNGVLFGKTAQVDVAGLVASTADVGTADFMAGRNNFTAPGHPAATVENRGSITVRDAGLAAFVAPQVVNSGSITARLGKVQLAGADTFTLDLYGDGLIQLAVTAEQTKTLLENSGTIRADGGQITLTAVVARNMVDSVLTTSGQLSAATLGAQQGHIRLAQQTEDAASAALPSRGVLVNSGTVSASGSAPGSTGGTVTLSSQAIHQTGTVSTDGAAQGGRIQVSANTLFQQGALSSSSPGGTGGTITLATQKHYVETAAARTLATGGQQGGRISVGSSSNGRGWGRSSPPGSNR